MSETMCLREIIIKETDGYLVLLREKQDLFHFESNWTMAEPDDVTRTKSEADLWK